MQDVIVVDGASDEVGREYVRKVHVNLICDDAELQRRMRWLPGAKRPSVGIRWAVSVQLTGFRNLPAIEKAKDLAKITGPAVPMLGAWLQMNFNEGKFGAWPPASDSRCREVGLLGIGKQAELIEMAAQQGLQAIVVASLTSQPVGLSGRSSTRMTVRLVDVVGKKVMWASRVLSSREVAAAEPTGGDPMGKLLKEVIERVDKLFVLTPMPTLRPEHVKRRLDGLFKDGLSAADDPDKLLPLLAEVRYYQSKQLLSAPEAIAYYDRIVGVGKGQVLAAGDPTARRTLLQAWLE